MKFYKITKVKILVSVSLLFIIILSCNTPSKNSDFGIKLDLVMQSNDSIHTYYMTNGTINFNETNSFWTKIKGNKKNQKITLQFPKDIVPNQFRLDFGKNRNQPDIVLNKVECIYKNNSFVLKGKEIYKTLRVDEANTILERDLGILKRRHIKQLNGPSLYPNGDYLRKKLEQLTTEKTN